MSVSDFFQKLKGAAQAGRSYFRSGLPLDVVLVVSVVLVGTAGFGLGRLSVSERGGKSVRIAYPEPSDLTAQVAAPSAVKAITSPSSPTLRETGQQVLASKNGTKYHLPNCPGANRIAEQNKIYFTSKAEAERAGYSPAANCKGI